MNETDANEKKVSEGLEQSDADLVEKRQKVGLDSMSSSYVTAMSHFYRGEMARTLTWRQRLDPTTNWALVTSAAFISVAFSEESVSHLIFLPLFLLLHILLLIEARRYRFYDAWRARLRMIEAHFMVPVVLENMKLLQGNWKKLLAEDLLLPSYKMSRLESIGRRLKRNYVWIFLFILLSWGSKIVLDSYHGDGEYAVVSVNTFLAAVGREINPGWVPVTVFVMATVEVLIFCIWAVLLKEYSGDIGPRRRDARPWRV